MKPTLYLFSIVGIALSTGCGDSPSSAKPIATDSYSITLTQVHSNDTKQSYSLAIQATFPFEADITSGSNFYNAGSSTSGTNGVHAMTNIQFLASRTSKDGSIWHRDHAEIKTDVASVKSSVSVKLDSPFDQTLSLVATSGTYRVGTPLLLGTRESGALKLHIAASQD